MVQGYLLDTNMIRYLSCPRGVEHDAASQRLAVVSPDAPVYISAISLGEIEFGHRWEADADTAIQRKLNMYIRETFPAVLPVTESTRYAYGKLRAELFRRFGGSAKRRTWPEDLLDAATAKPLGIQENDLWLVSQAVERRLVLVTNDRMTHIREVTGDDLDVENWVVA